jgi:hypothetical protein
MNRLTSSLHNVSVTWTTRISHRPVAWRGGWLGFVDAIGHRLNLPSRLMRPICDLYDIWAGIPKADLIAMDYIAQGKRVPWWLR